MSDQAPVLRLRGVGKTFPGQMALADVGFDVCAGEVHALLGENGSGKSTLIKCLAGVHTPDPGSAILVGGEALPPGYSQQDARGLGLCFVHQDPGLLPNLTVVENLALWRGFQRRGLLAVDWPRERERALEVLVRFEVDVDVDAEVRNLSTTARTLVAIARSLWDASEGGKVLVLDEPTAALPEIEAERLFKHLRHLVAERGLAIIYVSHRLDEIFRIADRATVLRDGRRVGTYDLADLSEDDLVAALVGRELSDLYPATLAAHHGAEPAAAPLIELMGVDGERVRNVSFAIRPGEVVGLAGLAGSGRSEIARLVAGAQRPVRGAIRLDGRAVTFQHPADAIRRGIVYVPEDRRGQACILGDTVGRNVTLTSLSALAPGGVIRQRAERRLADRLIRRYNVRPADTSRTLATLSGGNQQKAVLAKWLHREPRLVVLDEPVQGIDVGAKAEVHGFIADAVARGAAVLLVDSEFENLAHLADRVLVLRGGEIVQQLTGPECTRDHIVERVFATKAAA